jgi:hypothetical protein
MGRRSKIITVLWRNEGVRRQRVVPLARVDMN